MRMLETLELAPGDVADGLQCVQDITTLDQAVLEARLDEVEAALASSFWYISDGHEVEFKATLQEGRSKPPRDEFYAAYLERMCGSIEPPDITKGGIVDPRQTASPIFVTTDANGKYIWEEGQGPDLMETATMPSTSWRESWQRYETVLLTLAGVAAEFKCGVAILGTHLSSSANWLASNNALVAEDNFREPDKLIAMQRARAILRLIEPCADLITYETYPSKAVSSALYRGRIEERYAAFASDVSGGVADTRVRMLGARAGVNQLVTERIPLKSHEHAMWHRCERIGLFHEARPVLGNLSGLMVWDYDMGRMVLPNTVTRGKVRAGLGREALTRLDALAGALTGQDTADFALNNAAVLREAITNLTLDGDGVIGVISGSAHESFWNSTLEGAEYRTSPSARLLLSGEGETAKDFVTARKEAQTSLAVAALLGEDLQAALTDPHLANTLRERMRVKRA
jgi:hypothetical protein